MGAAAMGWAGEQARLTELEGVEERAYGRFSRHALRCGVCGAPALDRPLGALCVRGRRLLRAWDRAEAAIADVLLGGAA